MAAKTTKHISLVFVGDTVLHNGVERTVCANDIKRCAFMGVTLFGDSYSLGHRPVIVVNPSLSTEGK